MIKRPSMDECFSFWTLSLSTRKREEVEAYQKAPENAVREFISCQLHVCKRTVWSVIQKMHFYN